MASIVEVIGAIGLMAITASVLLRKKKKQDELFIVGGVLLEIYSISIQNMIFIVLKLIFTLVAVYDFFSKRRAK